MAGLELVESPCVVVFVLALVFVGRSSGEAAP